MAPRRILLAGFLALARGSVKGSVRSLEERQSAGECAATGSFHSDYYTNGKLTGELPSQASIDADTGIESSDLIEIKYGLNFKVLLERNAKTFYVLTQCGTAYPKQADVDKVMLMPTGYTRKDFSIPLQSVGIETTIVLGYIEALGIFDRVRYVSQYAGTTCGLKLLGCEAKTDRENQLSTVDAWFMDGDVNSIPKAVQVSASKDPGPIHTAEHIKFVAAFFNKEKEAAQFFSNQVTSYANQKGSLTPKPKVAWISKSCWGGCSFTVSLAHYKQMFVTNAGGQNIDGAKLKSLVPGMTESTTVSGTNYKLSIQFANESKPLFDAFRTLSVGVVIDESYAPTPKTYGLSNFLETYGLEANTDLDFVTDKMVLRTDGTITPSNGLDWFTSRPARPDWAAEGLARVLHKDASKAWHFFRNIAKDEQPKVEGSDLCTTTLPACTAGAKAAVIPLMTTVSDKEASNAMAAATSAGLVFLTMLLSFN